MAKLNSVNNRGLKEFELKRYRDLVGLKFGSLTVLSFIRGPIKGGLTYDSRKYVTWLCLCDCGNLCEQYSHNLTKGNNKTCGCALHKPKKVGIPEIGKTYHRLTLIEDLGFNGNNRLVCKFSCACGGERVAKLTLVINGWIKSCGCLEGLGKLSPYKTRPKRLEYIHKKEKYSINRIIRATPEYIQWRKSVVRRDGNCCTYCGVKRNLANIHAHHIKPLSVIIRENNIVNLEDAFSCPILWDVSNGLTLCSKCHKDKDLHKGV